MKFIEHSKCLYTIVLPKNANEECKFAVKELLYVIKKACNDVPSVMEECDTLPELCLHIGDTSVALAAGVKPTVKQVGTDGYVLKTRGKTIFISSFGREGVIYGVYEFLYRVLGAEYFGYMAYEIPETEDADVFKGEYMRKPEFEKRSRGISWAALGREEERRFGFNEGDGMPWVEFEHSFFRLIPKEKYYAEHPDWYSSDGKQLCLTNEGLLEEMKKVVIQRLTPKEFEKGDMLAFSIGHEDNNTFCNCSRCKREIKKYGKSGVTVRFVNEIADVINAFVEENYPTKTVKTVFFGYGPTIDPPVKWLEDGGCSPLHRSVIAHKNVAVMLAPLGTNWAYSMLDEKHNGRTRASLIGWGAVKAELFVWTYDGLYHDMPMMMDTWEYLKESYQIFKNNNAMYLFDENSRMQQLDMLRTYVRGKLMWNLNYDVEELVKHFMKHYYKEAWQKMYEYFQYFRANTKKQEAYFERQGKPFAIRSFVHTQPYYATGEFWSKEFLECSIEIMESAKQGLINDGTASVCSRVEQEMVSLVCMYLQFYGHELPKEKVKYYVDFLQRVMTACSMINENGTKGGAYGIFYKRLTEWRSMAM